MERNLSFMQLLPDYLSFVNGCAGHFPSHHREDLCQEGLMGLFSACQTYDEATGVPFDAYAKTCIRNRMIDAYRRLRPDDSVEELDEQTESSASEDGTASVVTRVFFDQLRERLTDIEKKVFDEYLKDKAYSDITEETGLSSKQIDNALSRIKTKIKQLYKD